MEKRIAGLALAAALGLPAMTTLFASAHVIVFTGTTLLCRSLHDQRRLHRRHPSLGRTGTGAPTTAAVGAAPRARTGHAVPGRRPTLLLEGARTERCTAMAGVRR